MTDPYAASRESINRVLRVLEEESDNLDVGMVRGVLEGMHAGFAEMFPVPTRASAHVDRHELRRSLAAAPGRARRV
jgi:hypothetical protein